MGDVSRDRSSQSTKITDENENDFAKVSPNKDLGSFDIQDTTLDHTIKNVDSVSPFLLNVTGTNMINRKELIIENMGNKRVYIGKSIVTKSGVNQGRLLDVGSELVLPYGPNIDVYAIAENGNSDLFIQETA